MDGTANFLRPLYSCPSVESSGGGKRSSRNLISRFLRTRKGAFQRESGMREIALSRLLTVGKREPTKILLGLVQELGDFS